MANEDFEKSSEYLIFIARIGKYLSNESINILLSSQTLEKTSQCKTGRELMELIDSLELPELQQKKLTLTEGFKADPVLDKILQTGEFPTQMDLEDRIFKAGMSDAKASGTFTEEVADGASGGAQAGAVVGGVVGGFMGGSVGCAAGVAVGAVSGGLGGALGGTIKWAIGD